MADDLRILLSASLHHRQSVREINAAIKKIENSTSLQKIKLKIDVDQKILKTLTDFNNNLNKINQTMGQQKTSTDSVTSSINKETQAINQQNIALAKNETMRQKIIKDDFKKTTYTTKGNKFDNTTSSRTEFTDGALPVNHKETVQNLNPEALRADVVKQNLASEKAIHDNFVKLQREKYNLTIGATKQNLADEKARYDSFVKQEKEKYNISKNNLADEQKLYDDFTNKQRENYNTANKIAEGRIEEQDKFNKLEDKAQQSRLNAAHRLADIENKARDKSSNARLKLEQGTDSFWQKALFDREQKEIASAQTVKEARTKLEQGEDSRWQKLLHDRDVQERTIDGKRIKDIDDAHFQAFNEKMKREANLGNSQMQDRAQANNMAIKQDEEFNRKRFINEQKFNRMQQDSINKIESARAKFGHNAGANEMLDGNLHSLNQINAKTKDWENSIKNVNGSVAKGTAGMKQMRNESVGFIDGFKTAMVKFPIWMAAATAFYAPLRLMSTAVDNILKIDTQMTELSRVMDSSTNFENMLKGSVELSKELGRSLVEVNEAMVGFARQGFSESQVLDLTKTATLATNISDLKADEAMDAITAAMVVFNIEASKSIEIVNAINEVDNNFAVTSKNLAVSLQKSASAGKTFGVSMHEMLGDATAIMMATRESGAVAGNSLKTIYSRLTTMQPSIDALANIGVNIHDSNGELKSATQILDETAVKFKTLNDETKQNTAVTLAGKILTAA